MIKLNCFCFINFTDLLVITLSFPQILIDTDDLKGRTLTAVLNVRKDLSNAGAHVVDESVVVDNNIVTSRVPDDLDDFNREIVKQLQ